MVLTLALLVGGCSAPTAPAPPAPPNTQPPPPPPPPAPNVAPVIASITASRSRAEVEDAIVITAAVTDAETPVENLKYTWAVEVGEITGEGRVVTVKVPRNTKPTPIELKVTLTVTESYAGTNASGQLATLEHRVVQSATLTRVHDSAAELSAMSLRFLLDLFGNSRVPADQCVVDFWTGCPGKDAELDDIKKNRVGVPDSRCLGESHRRQRGRRPDQRVDRCSRASSAIENCRTARKGCRKASAG